MKTSNPATPGTPCQDAQIGSAGRTPWAQLVLILYMALRRQPISQTLAKARLLEKIRPDQEHPVDAVGIDHCDLDVGLFLDHGQH